MLSLLDNNDDSQKELLIAALKADTTVQGPGTVPTNGDTKSRSRMQHYSTVAKQMFFILIYSSL